MKNRKLKIISSFLACALLLLILSFGIKPRAETQNADSDLPENLVVVGQDSESLYNLGIELKVLYDTDADAYIVTATAEWQKAGAFTRSEKRAEDVSADRIVLGWGGENSLCADSVNVSGTYSNGGDVSFSKTSSDSLEGFVWQFNEKSKSGYMNSATVTFNLKKPEEYLGKETAIKMTYVHTYSRLKPSMTMNFGTNFNKLSYSKVEKNWKIEISVPKIEY